MTTKESIELGAETRMNEVMLERNHIAARARALELTAREYRRLRRDLEMAEFARQRRVEVCRTAATALAFGSGLYAAVSAWCYWCGNPLAALGALVSAAVAAVVGFWCEGWARR